MNIALFDYGVGNLHSLSKAIEGGGARVSVTHEWERALSADALVLPGVGAFSAAVQSLPDDPAPIREALRNGLPCLGICLGMQILFDRSAEGEGAGIGIIEGSVRRLEADIVPQMGWNDVSTVDDPLFEGITDLVAYYANSFVCEPDDPGVAVARTRYESDEFTAAVRRGNTWGVQFHPEKSSAPGRRLIHNFIEAARPAGGRR